MSNLESCEVITCASCEYRFPRSEEVCTICGLPVPPLESVLPAPIPPDQATRASHQIKPWLLISIGVVSMALMVFATFLRQVRQGKAPEATSSTAEFTPGMAQSVEREAAPGVQNSAVGVQPLINANLRTSQTADSVNGSDPRELWKAVKRGSMRAEVALARLYLEGVAVSQNCEQAHMLLLGASRKGSKAAETILAGAYTQQCQ